MSQRYLGGVITANPTAPTLSSASGVWTLEQQYQNFATWSPQLVSRSVRLRASASAYFNRTIGTPTLATKLTYSGWVKRGALGINGVFFSLGQSTGTANYLQCYFSTADTIQVYGVSSSSAVMSVSSAAVFRDPSAWYHIIVAIDTTQATGSDRVKIYVNGVAQTVTTGTAITQNANVPANTSTYISGLGAVIYSAAYTNYFDGYLTEVNFVDGQALTPSSFGAFDSNGIWQPLPYTGTYGTNGFYLTFADNSAATAAAIGKDYSGNGNNWTPNNISVTAGVTYDSMIDSPTNYADGGNGRGNYAVLNPLGGVASAYLPTNGNLRCYTANGAVNWTPLVATIALQSNFYAEISPSQIDTYWTLEFGVTQKVDPTGNVSMGQSGYGICLQQAYNGAGNTTVRQNSATSYTFGGGNWSTSDTFMVAYEASTGKVYFGRNGTWYNSGVPSSGTGYVGTLDTTLTQYFAVGFGAGGFNANFGQRPFAYTPPTGFKALNTFNLPDSTITNGKKNFDVSLWTGNGSSQSIVNSGGFAPDLVWFKSRSSGALWNVLCDTIRGATKELYSNSTSAEATDVTDLTAFNSNGFSVGSGNGANQNAGTYVGWQWKAGGTAVSNTAGSITSQVSANVSAGFSVVTGTTPASGNFTAGHGLGVSPAFLITKMRTPAGWNWHCWHKSLSSATNSVLTLNTTNAVNNSFNMWGASGVSSTTIGGTVGTAFDVSSPFVAYCFSEVAGYSKFGSYTGNGSADGPFVYCGFRPRWVMVKASSTTGDWPIADSSRDTYNQMNDVLFADLSNAENNTYGIDFTSNGFKLRSTAGNTNSSGVTYIFAVFAENPFNIARAR